MRMWRAAEDSGLSLLITLMERDCELATNKVESERQKERENVAYSATWLMTGAKLVGP